MIQLRHPPRDSPHAVFLTLLHTANQIRSSTFSSRRCPIFTYLPSCRTTTARSGSSTPSQQSHGCAAYLDWSQTVVERE